MRDSYAAMGMPIVVDIPGGNEADLERVFAYFDEIDARFSTYKPASEISRYNRGEIASEELSAEMREVFDLAERERERFAGYFDIRTPAGALDPSGVVKGWAIRNVARGLSAAGFQHYWVEAGGDIQTAGVNEAQKEWAVGIRNPFDHETLVDIICPRGNGVATSGTYLRGAHIYDPHSGMPVATPFISLSVIAADVYEADIWATAAFAMGERGIEAIADAPGVEGYAISSAGIATRTDGWPAFRPL